VGFNEENNKTGPIAKYRMSSSKKAKPNMMIPISP